MNKWTWIKRMIPKPLVFWSSQISFHSLSNLLDNSIICTNLLFNVYWRCYIFPVMHLLMFLLPGTLFLPYPHCLDQSPNLRLLNHSIIKQVSTADLSFTVSSYCWTSDIYDLYFNLQCRSPASSAYPTKRSKTNPSWMVEFT